MLSLDLFVTQIQSLKRRCSDSTRIALKVLAAFRANTILQLILLFLQLCTLHEKVPEALREPLQKELDSLVDQGILAKVTEPTDWVNSLVCVAKNTGALRLCLDPKDLNYANKRPHYFTPTLEVILPQLNGAKCFSILDARSGYWNIKLDQESSLLTTFNSPFGRQIFASAFRLNLCPGHFPKKGR